MWNLIVKKKRKKVQNWYDDINYNTIELRHEKTPCATDLIILIDSVYRNDKSYYSEVLLQELKYMLKYKTKRYHKRFSLLCLWF